MFLFFLIMCDYEFRITSVQTDQEVCRTVVYGGNQRFAHNLRMILIKTIRFFSISSMTVALKITYPLKICKGNQHFSVEHNGLLLDSGYPCRRYFFTPYISDHRGPTKLQRFPMQNACPGGTRLCDP